MFTFETSTESLGIIISGVVLFITHGMVMSIGARYGQIIMAWPPWLRSSLRSGTFDEGLYFNIDIILWHILDQMPSMLSTRCPRKEFLLLPIIVAVGWLVFWDTCYLA